MLSKTIHFRMETKELQPSNSFGIYLEKNKNLYLPDGSKRISESALVALTLQIAESKPEEKEMMINVVVNLINRT